MLGRRGMDRSASHGWHADWMPELVLDGVNGRSLTLSEPTARDPDGIWSYRAALALPEGHGETMVWDIGDDLATYLHELAEAWEGFEGVKEFNSLEGQLSLVCRHDGRGSVECTATVGQQEPSTWNLSAYIDFGPARTWTG